MKQFTVEYNIYSEVKNRCMQTSNIYGIEVWDYHIKIVYELSKKYASKYNADIKIVSLAALLHDIASVTDEKFIENHHIIGSKLAEELLVNQRYSKEKIELIKKCILNHRVSVPMDKASPEEICLVDMNAMAHFYSIPSLFNMAYKENMLSVEKGNKYVIDKLDRNYNKMSTKGKQLVKTKYDAVKTIFK